MQVLLIPLAFILCRLPETLYRVLEFYDSGTVLPYLHRSSFGARHHGPAHTS